MRESSRTRPPKDGDRAAAMTASRISSRATTTVTVVLKLFLSSLLVVMARFVSCPMMVEAFQPQPLLPPIFSSMRQQLETTTSTSTTTTVALWGKAPRRGKLGSEIRELVNDGGNDNDDNTAVSSFGKKKDDRRRTAAAAAAAAVDKKKKSSSGKDTAASSSVVVSPALAQWASSQGGGGGDTTDAATTTTPITMTSSSAAAAAATTFVTFNNDDDDDDDGDEEENIKATTSSKKLSSSSSSKRRVKQSERIAAEQAWNAQLEALVEELLNVLENEDGTPKKKSPPLQDILNPIRQILQVASSSSSSSSLSSSFVASSLRSLAAGGNKKPYDYRLAWVGSDDAICHVGTSLHKVPLARLQEVFLSFPGRNRVQLQEVIRVIGPFPNVLNNLQGQSKSKTMNVDNNADNDNLQEWTITWDSMIDGTGKELMAGTEKDARIVQLQVHVSSPTVLIAVIPPSFKNDKNYTNDGPKQSWRTDPLQDDGRHVLVFVREDDLLDKLESLRVA